MALSKILVSGIKIYAHHGCLKEEAIIGGNYIVDICLEADLDKPAKSDKLKDTLDYVTVHEIVKREMSVRSELIEHVARRILVSLKKEFAKTGSIEVKVTKLHPPIPGDVEQVSVILSDK